MERDLEESGTGPKAEDKCCGEDRFGLREEGWAKGGKQGGQSGDKFYNLRREDDPGGAIGVEGRVAE